MPGYQNPAGVLRSSQCSTRHGNREVILNVINRRNFRALAAKVGLPLRSRPGENRREPQEFVKIGVTENLQIGCRETRNQARTNRNCGTVPLHGQAALNLVRGEEVLHIQVCDPDRRSGGVKSTAFTARCSRYVDDCGVEQQWRGTVAVYGADIARLAIHPDRVAVSKIRRSVCEMESGGGRKCSVRETGWHAVICSLSVSE